VWDCIAQVEAEEPHRATLAEAQHMRPTGHCVTFQTPSWQALLRPWGAHRDRDRGLGFKPLLGGALVLLMIVNSTIITSWISFKPLYYEVLR
jgi:hypothetical protein